MTLIDGWSRKIHKLWTTRLAAGGMALSIANDTIPGLQGVLPNKWYLVFFGLIFVLRLVAQPSVHDGTQ